MLIIEIYYCIIYIFFGIYEYIKSIFFKDYRIRKLEILNKYINKVIYINLDERNERRESIEVLLNKIFDKDKIIRCNAIKDNNGAIGCTKSHIKCLKLAIENEWDNVLIMEDDIMLTKNISEYIFENLVKNNFDVIVLGGTEVSYNPFNYKLLECQTTGSYLVKKLYFKKLKDNFEEGLEKLLNTNIKREFAIDQYWTKLQRVDNWKIIYQPLFMQKERYSNIENKIVNYHKFYDIKSLYKHKIEKTLIYIFVYMYIKLINYYNLNVEMCVLIIFLIDFGIDIFNKT